VGGKGLCLVISGAVIHLFPVDGSKPRWSLSAWNSSYVQDRQVQVWDHCSELDSEVCYGLARMLEGWLLFSPLIC